jgi:hypothetical protein
MTGDRTGQRLRPDVLDAGHPAIVQVRAGQALYTG